MKHRLIAATAGTVAAILLSCGTSAFAQKPSTPGTFGRKPEKKPVETATAARDSDKETKPASTPVTSDEAKKSAPATAAAHEPEKKAPITTTSTRDQENRSTATTAARTRDLEKKPVATTPSRSEPWKKPAVPAVSIRDREKRPAVTTPTAYAPEKKPAVTAATMRDQETKPAVVTGNTRDQEKKPAATTPTPYAPEKKPAVTAAIMPAVVTASFRDQEQKPAATTPITTPITTTTTHELQQNPTMMTPPVASEPAKIPATITGIVQEPVPVRNWVTSASLPEQKSAVTPAGARESATKPISTTGARGGDKEKKPTATTGTTTAARDPKSTPAAAPNPRPVAPTVDPRAAEMAGAYQIGPEDLLDISVWKQLELSRTVPVRPDGKVSLPLVNDIQAAGLTPGELREQITTRLAEYIPAPEVSVMVREVHSRKVAVMGAVKMPGRFDIKSPMTVLEAIALAQGLTDFASRDKIAVIRTVNGKTTRIPFNYRRIADGAEQENFFVRSGDIVIVP